MKFFRETDIGFARDQVEPLLHEHYLETCNFKDLAPRENEDWGKYEAIDNLGNLLVVLAYDDLKCVGYEVAFMTRHLHYDFHTAWSDLLYLSPAYRNGMAGGRLMRAMEDYCRDKGVALLQRHAKPDSALDRVLSKRKASPLFERVYAQRL